MKKASVVLLALVCIGCAASASHTYRPAAPAAGAPAAEWQIEGTQSTFGKMLIAINGTPVIQGSISVWSGTGQLFGTYQDQPVAAVCDKGSGYVRTRCVLTVNSEKIATLYFRAL